MSEDQGRTASVDLKAGNWARDVQLAVVQIGTTSGDGARRAKHYAYDQDVMALDRSCFGEIDFFAKTAGNCIRRKISSRA